MSLLDDENILMDNIKESSKPINILNSFFKDKTIWNKQVVEDIYIIFFLNYKLGLNGK